MSKDEINKNNQEIQNFEEISSDSVLFTEGAVLAYEKFVEKISKSLCPKHRAEIGKVTVDEKFYDKKNGTLLIRLKCEGADVEFEIGKGEWKYK